MMMTVMMMDDYDLNFLPKGITGMGRPCPIRPLTSGRRSRDSPVQHHDIRIVLIPANLDFRLCYARDRATLVPPSLFFFVFLFSSDLPASSRLPQQYIPSAMIP